MKITKFSNFYEFFLNFLNFHEKSWFLRKLCTGFPHGFPISHFRGSGGPFWGVPGYPPPGGPREGVPWNGGPPVPDIGVPEHEIREKTRFLAKKWGCHGTAANVQNLMCSVYTRRGIVKKHVHFWSKIDKNRQKSSKSPKIDDPEIHKIYCQPWKFEGMGKQWELKILLFLEILEISRFSWFSPIFHDFQVYAKNLHVGIWIIC